MDNKWNIGERTIRGLEKRRKISAVIGDLMLHFVIYMQIINQSFPFVCDIIDYYGGM